MVTLNRTPSSCHPTCTVTFTASASDPDGDPLSYAWSGCTSGTGPSRTCQITALNTIVATVTVSDGRGGIASDSATATGVNQAPTLSSPPAKTWPKNTDVVFQFTVADDDPANTGSTVNYTVPGQVGTKQGCSFWQGSKWQCELHTSSGGGSGTISWTYKDKWGASVNGSFTATVQ
jgi:hypothetical protein